MGLQTHHRLIRSLFWIGFVVVFFIGSGLFLRRKSSGDFSKAFTSMMASIGKLTGVGVWYFPLYRGSEQKLDAPPPAGCHALAVTRSPDIVFPRVFVYMPRQNGSGISVALQQKVRAYISQINAKSR